MDFIYIFGAGASAGKYSSYGNDSWLMDSEFKLKPSSRTIKYDQVIPTIYRIADRVEAMSIRLTEQLRSGHFVSDSFEIINSITNKLHKLSWELNRESFPDIHAETLHTIDHERYVEFIKIFNLYLMIEQMFIGVDKRYKVFFTNLLQQQSQSILPKNIKLFSWNYDYQMEEAFYEKRPLVGPFDEFMNSIIINPKDFQKITTNFVSVKLNGYAPLLKHVTNQIVNDETKNNISNSNPIYFSTNEEGRKKRIQSIGNRLVELHNNIFDSEFNPSLRFAWQNDSSNEIIEELNSLKGKINAKEIIVIGYSFPTLNNKIDTALLKTLHNPTKIYLQVNKDDFDTIKARVDSILKSITNEQKEIIFVDPNQDFFIPYNLLSNI